jgi:hypothetical protein
VTLTSGTTTPLENTATFPVTEVLGKTTYTLTRCVYWVNATTAQVGAYKQSIVTVTWLHDGKPLTEASAIYPGGEAPYKGADNNWAPSGTVPPSATVEPPPPTIVSVGPASSDPVHSAVVVWTPPSGYSTGVQYVIDYWELGSSGQPSSTSVINGAPQVDASGNPTGNLQFIVTGLSGGTTYYFDVASIWQGQTATAAQAGSTSSVMSTTTNSPVAGCTVSSLNVQPSGTAQVNGQGFLTAQTTFNLTVHATGCGTNVTVAYDPQNSGTSSFASLTQSSGTYTGTAGTSSTQWTTGNHSFTVWVGGSQWSPLVQQQVDICKGQSC